MAEEQEEVKSDYTSEDVGIVLRQVSFHFWGEVVDWLRKNGIEQTNIGPIGINKMMQDFEKLRQEGIEFTNDPEEADRLAKEHRED